MCTTEITVLPYKPPVEFTKVVFAVYPRTLLIFNKQIKIAMTDASKIEENLMPVDNELCEIKREIIEIFWNRK